MPDAAIKTRLTRGLLETEGALYCLRLYEETGQGRQQWAQRLGLTDLPAPGRSSTAGGVCTVWIEPKAWLLLSEIREERVLENLLAAENTQDGGILTDLSAGLRVITLAGADATAVLAAGCPLPLGEARFGLHDAASSHFNEIPIRIVYRRPGPVFSVLCERSHAANLLALFDNAVGRGP